MSAAPDTLAADHFDGVSARARRVQLHIAGPTLHVAGDGVSLKVPLADVRWPERTRHGARVAHFASGGSVQALDAAGWDAWLRRAGVAESAVVKAQQSWRSTLVAVLLLLVLAAAGFQWGVPWLTRGVLAALPGSADRAIGDAVLNSFEGALLLPSSVPAARQQALRDALARAVARDPHPAPYELRFHTSPKLGTAADAKTRLGANAFALPGGTVVVTDEMLELLQGRDDVLIGVLGHELGHVRRRHGMRMLIQASLIGAAASIAWGDFSTVLATAPVLLGQSAYSRDFEREADADAVVFLRANGLSPAVMLELFERLGRNRVPKGAEPPAPGGGFDLGIALASHPADAERVQRFRDAAAR